MQLRGLCRGDIYSVLTRNATIYEQRQEPQKSRYIGYIKAQLWMSNFLDYFLLSLKVRNGPDASSPLLGTRLCGSSPPPLLQTTDNHLFVHFVSDASNEGNGFRLTFEAHSQGTARSPPSIGLLVSGQQTSSNIQQHDELDAKVKRRLCPHPEGSCFLSLFFINAA